MAYTFLKAQGLPVGKSLVEDDKLDAARDVDGDGRRARRRASSCRSITSSPTKIEAGVADRDAGGRRCRPSAIGWASTSVRRPPALYADDASRREDRRLERPDGRVRDRRRSPRARSPSRKAVAGVKGTTIIGGGDSVVGGRRRPASPTSITHISTGGGASLEFLGGAVLPGVAALTDG